MRNRLAAGILMWGLFAAVAFVPASHFKNPLGALLIAVMLFLAPGAAWVGIMGFKRRSILHLVCLSAMASAGLIVACLLVRVALGLPASRTAWLLLLGCAGGIGFLITRSVEMWAKTFGEIMRSRRELVLWVISALIVWSALFQVATTGVPALEDHDLEIQGTAYGLVHTLTPASLTDRYTVFYFAHPPIHHILVAATFLAYDSLDEVAYYFTPIPDLVPLSRGGTVPSSPEVKVTLGKQYAKFNEQPNLFETRLDNVLYSVMTILLLAGYAMRSPAGRLVGLLCVTAYATAPEIMVRMTYGGYMATTNFWMVAVALLYLSSVGNRVLMGASYVMALVNHKTVILPFCLAVVDVFHFMRSQPRETGRVFLGMRALLTFAGGTLCFWLYGLIIEPASFVTDHLFNHILDRVLHHNPLGYSGYPSVLRLWFEFVVGVGPSLLIVGGLGFIGHLTKYQSLRSPIVSLILWFTLGAVVFSVIDWRQTKHLMLIAPALVLLGCSHQYRQAGRTIVTGILVAGIVYNINMAVLVLQNFGRWVPSPGW